MEKKRWIAVGAVALVAVLGVVGWRGVSAGRPPDGQPPETAVVQRGELLVVVEATGNLAPRSEISLAFPSGGRVEDVLVEEGQVVEAGRPLARLETDELELQVAQAEAALAAAEAQLAQLLASPRPEEVAVQEANLRAYEAQLSASAATRDQVAAGADEGQIAAAEADLASAIAEQKSAFDGHENTMTCVTIPAGTPVRDGTILPEEETICPALGPPEERARYALAVADASLASAQAQLDDLLDGPDAESVRAAQADVAAAVGDRDAAQAQLDLTLAGTMEEEIQTTRASVDDARAALEQARVRLEKATLTAPAGGTITLLDLQPGQIVNANQAIVAVSDLSTLEVEVHLDETDVAQVAVGREASVSVDAFPGVQMDGDVVSIATVAQTQAGVVLYPVTVRLSPEAPIHRGVRAGMTAEASIVAASREDALIVPLRAVRTEGQRAYVERLVDGRVEPVEVELGLITDTQIEIAAGLEEGDVIVVVPAPERDTGGFSGPLGILGGGDE